MKPVTLHMPDKKYPLFIELVKNIDFIKKNEEEDVNTEKKQMLNGLKQAVQEVNLIKAGKLKGVNAKDFLNEL